MYLSWGRGTCTNRPIGNTDAKAYSPARKENGGSLLLVTLLFFTGCYPASKEGNRISRIGGNVITNGRSDDLMINDPDFSSFATGLCGKGNADVYPCKGDIRSSTAAGRPRII